MKIIKIGIFGLGRGSAFFDNILLNNGEIVAVCDRDESKLEEVKKHIGDNVTTYTDFDNFINHPDMEAVFLCNYFHEHTEYAIKALKKDIHVLSECTSNATMAGGVDLVRAVENSKAFYMLAENYPFMKFNCEMNRIVKGGTLGKLLYAEGEYNHPLNPDSAHEIKQMRPYPTHWRNYLPRSYYITHSLAPLMYISGAFPVRVTAMPCYMEYSKKSLLKNSVEDRAAIITCLNDDDSVYRVTGCAAFGAHHIAYRFCGEKGQIENVRGTGDIMLRYNDWCVPDGKNSVNYYSPEWHDDDRTLIEKAGHGGGDFIIIREFFDCIRENKAPVFDVYFATRMASVAILSHRSLLEYGTPYDIPDFKKEADRLKFENDTLSPFYSSDGGTPTIQPCSHAMYKPTEEEKEYYNSLYNN